MGWYSDDSWGRYVTAAERRSKAFSKIAKMK